MPERLNLIIKHLDISIYAFAKNIGITQQTFSNYLKGRIPSADVIEKIVEKYPEINCRWLITGKGEMYIENSIQTTENIKNETHNTIENIKIDKNNKTSFSISEFKQNGYAPYYLDLQVSARKYDLANVEQNETPSGWIKIKGIDIEYLFSIIGCSMEPKIHTGDIIGVVSCNDRKKIDPDKIYLLIANDEIMIKHLEKDETDKNVIWAVSENYKRFKIYLNEIQTIYKIVWTGRFI